MEKKTLKDYLDLNDTEQMFFALYPLMRRGELSCVDVAELLGGNRDMWDILKMCSKYNLTTVVDEKRDTVENVLKEVENTKKFEVGYHG